jgi:hypothetical protein
MSRASGSLIEFEGGFGARDARPPRRAGVAPAKFVEVEALAQAVQ